MHVSKQGQDEIWSIAKMALKIPPEKRPRAMEMMATIVAWEEANHREDDRTDDDGTAGR